MNPLSSTHRRARVQPVSSIFLMLTLLAMLAQSGAPAVLAGPPMPNALTAAAPFKPILNQVESGWTISGQVLNSKNEAVPSITISTDQGGTATTGADGSYSITNVITGTYTLTPAMPGRKFSPPTRSVTVPPDATGQDFMLQAPGPIYLPVVHRPCLPTYRDDFSNPASGWPIAENENRVLGYLDGEYRILIKTANWMSWVWDDFGATDFRVEVDARAADHPDGAVSLVFGSNSDGFYLFEVSNGKFSLWRIDRGPWIWTPLVGWTSSPVIRTGTQPNRLMVVRSGASITLSINGVQVGSVWDGTYMGSGLGVEAGAYRENFDGRFDNFAVYTGACAAAPTAARSPNAGRSFRNDEIGR